jgi:hypothetical protein
MSHRHDPGEKSRRAQRLMADLFEIVFETPVLAPVEGQVAAAPAALETIVSRYRAMLAFGDALYRASERGLTHNWTYT